MRLVPRMRGVEEQVGIRMKDFEEWKPLLNKTSYVLPRPPALLIYEEDCWGARMVFDLGAAHTMCWTRFGCGS